MSFIESGVSMAAASRDVQNRPVQARAAGCRAAPDGSLVTLFVSRTRYPFLLDAVRRSGLIAVSFVEPSTHRSIQVKGEAAALGSLIAGDAERIAAYLDLFAADLERIHVRDGLARAVHAGPASELETISFTPITAFLQTPGPKAGSPLDAEAGRKPQA